MKYKKKRRKQNEQNHHARRSNRKITDGARIMVGGFGLVGSPLSLIEAIAKSNLKDLEIISNNLGEPGKGLGVLIQKNK